MGGAIWGSWPLLREGSGGSWTIRGRVSFRSVERSCAVSNSCTHSEQVYNGFARVARDLAEAGHLDPAKGAAEAGPHLVLVRRDQVADPIHEPWPGGTRAQMASLGIRITRITESFAAGMPNEHEAQTLRICTGVPLLRHTRRHIADTGRIVEVAHPIVRRGDTTVVDFVIDLED